MNAPIIRLVTTPTAEKRRASTGRDIAVALSALELDLRTKLPTLGNREAFAMLRAAYDKLDHQLARIECLADEFLEMAQAEEAEEQP